jgi:hypothetical protein
MKATTGKAVQTSVAVGGLSQLKRRFDQWRAGRQVGERIPPQLWDGAVGAVAEHGAYQVSRELKLDYAVLKRRTSRAAGNVPAREEAVARFVEVFAAAGPSVPAQACAECVVELANTRGAKMRVELRGSGLAGLPTLCNAFWGA